MTVAQSEDGRSILVTGGAGFIGAHVCKALAEAGYKPVAFDNLSRGHRSSVRWGPLVEADVGDFDAVEAAIVQYRPTGVIHLAAYAYVGESVTEPGLYYRNNVSATLTLLEAMRANGIERLVFSSSCATYGVASGGAIAEAHVQSPVNPYGRTKLVGELMIGDYVAAYGLGATILRYFNAAGSDPDGDIGEDHDPETHLIPLILRAASSKDAPLTIFGDDFDTPDGTCVRDYVHVSDLAKAHVLALEKTVAGTAQACNLGTGRGYSVREIIDAATRVTGKSIPFSIGPRRAGDPASLVADPSSAIGLLGWIPAQSDLDTMIATAWAWHCRTRSTASA